MQRNNGYKKRNRRGRRRKKRILWSTVGIVTVLALIFGVWAFAQMRGPELQKGKKTLQAGAGGDVKLPEIYSHHAIVLERDSGTMIAEKKGDERIYPASMTKIMTALLAVEQIEDLQETVTIPGDIYPKLYAENASMAGFEPGEEVRVEDLLYGALLPSGAECCLTLARETAGSEEAFVDLMNQKAEKLGMKDTHFSNVTGLYSASNYSTVKDIALLLRYALNNPEFEKVFESQTYETVSLGSRGMEHMFESTMFENLSSTKVNGGEILGGKTGYIEEAGQCLASYARIYGKEYIVVTAGAEGDHRTQQFHILDAVEIYNQLGETLK